MNTKKALRISKGVLNYSIAPIIVGHVFLGTTGALVGLGLGAVYYWKLR